MRKPAPLEPWLSEEEILVWLREAPDREAYKRRLAVWLTHLGPHYAHEVAEMLGVSRQAVWLWVGQYNKKGPIGLARVGRGGRRWSYLSWVEEEEILQPFRERAARGEVVSAKEIWPELSKAMGQEVSLAYVYKLLHRHVKSDKEAQERFKKNYPNSSGKR